MKTCVIPDCENPHGGRGWCSMHYKRWRATGDPLATKKMGPAPTPEADRFWKNVEKTESCWIWTGAKASEYGHGKFMVGRKNFKAHRWAYENLIGPIPEGLTLDHLCRVPACVYPGHLEPVTLEENVRRQGAARTHCPQGHPLTGENLYREPKNGYRACRICRANHSRAYRAKRTGGRTGQQ